MLKDNTTLSVVNASFVHPFTCVVSGPSGSGKTTFVDKLLRSRHGLIDTKFKYITIYLGTSAEENPIFLEFQKDNPDIVSIVEISKLYNGNKKEFEAKFAEDFLHATKEQGPGGCVIFDDLMQQLANANIISDLFSKHSSHLGISVFHITQNIFFKGKQPQEHRTLYNNTHHLVLFRQSLDQTVFRIVAGRLGLGGKKTAKILDMMNEVAKEGRYIVLSGAFKRDPEIRFTSDIFNENPFPFQRCFKLE
jgi:hypothetical protein